jgi:hypothetical protein
LRNYRTVLIIGVIEILIGSITLFFTFFSIAFSFNQKPPGVLAFVVIAAGLSTLLGIGILKFKKAAYQLLLYFSSVVLFSKILLLMGVIHLDGSLEKTIPSPFKTWGSIIYHGFVILYLLKPDVRAIYHPH